MRTDPEASLNRKFLEMVKLLNVYLNHFPKHEKYALCNQIRRTAYEIYDLITEGQKRYYKKTTLSNLDIAHERLRMQVYLAAELGYFRFKEGRAADKGAIALERDRYMAICRLIDEMGRMIGGWIKTLQVENKWQ